ncbi:hypothetical protein [Thioclava sp. GXIMD4216]|uniref:hypothetical protein n=1 Tax=Thioclava sp. GXIMD4216 TaxID=3131929 RepID=UPI0030CCFE89
MIIEKKVVIKHGGPSVPEKPKRPKEPHIHTISDEDRIAAFNEQVKIFSNTVNNLGLACFGFMVLRYVGDGFGKPGWLQIITGLAFMVAFHWISQDNLTRLRKEKKVTQAKEEENAK